MPVIYPQPRYASRFVGWWRTSGAYPWKDIAAGLTEGEAWDKLLDEAPRGGDRVVLHEGNDPNRERLPVRRRR
jgi:hypothetical protein